MNLGVDVCGLAGSWKHPTGHHQFGDEQLGGPPSSFGRGGPGSTQHRQVPALWRRPGYAGQRYKEPVQLRVRQRATAGCKIAGTVKTSVVVAYSPHSGQRRQRKAFFTDLQKVLNKIPGMDVLILLGDFNSKVGSATSAAASASYGGSLWCTPLAAMECGTEQLRRGAAALHLPE